MLENEQTIKKYSYSIDSLSNGSSKKIVVSCDYCNLIFDKPLKARNIQNKELDKDCCSKCKFKKREELSLLKYGVKNSAQREDIKLCDYDMEDHKDSILNLLNEDYSISYISKKLNIPQTSLKRYLTKIGVDTKGDLQKKKKKTFVEKYGENHQEVFLKKRQATNLAKYGHDNVFANEEIKAKIVETMRDKYGADHHMQTDSMKERVKKTNLDKYGYENVAQSPEIQDKIRKTNSKRQKHID